MIVSCNKVFIGYAIQIADVIEEDFYIENEKQFYACQNSRSHYNRECLNYYRSDAYEEYDYDVLPEMLNDINFAWTQYLKYKQVDNSGFDGLEFSAFYDGFNGRNDIEYHPEGCCILIFGRELKGSLFKLSQTEKSTSFNFNIDFPADVRDLLAEFFNHIKSQQSSYKTIKEFPVEPIFSQRTGISSDYSSRIIFDIFGSCVAGGD